MSDASDLRDWDDNMLVELTASEKGLNGAAARVELKRRLARPLVPVSELLALEQRWRERSTRYRQAAIGQDAAEFASTAVAYLSVADELAAVIRKHTGGKG